jgi:hypothetical protein
MPAESFHLKRSPYVMLLTESSDAISAALLAPFNFEFRDGYPVGHPEAAAGRLKWPNY